MTSSSISLIREDDQDINIVLTQSPTDDTPYDLTGCAFEWEVRRESYRDSPIQTKTITEHVDAVNGLSKIPFAEADTADFDDRPYRYRIRLITAAGKKITLETGDLTVLPSQ